MAEKRKLLINQLKKEIGNQDEEIKKLELVYLKKIDKLFIMSQIHCEIKKSIYEEFEKLGIKTQINDKEVSFSENQNLSFYNKL